MPDLSQEPNFDSMTDAELTAYLDQLREQNKANQPRKVSGASSKPKTSTKKDYVKVDL